LSLVLAASVQIVIGRIQAVPLIISAATPLLAGIGISAFVGQGGLMRPAPGEQHGDTAIRASRGPRSLIQLAALELKHGQPGLNALAGAAVAVGTLLIGGLSLLSSGFRGQLGNTVLENRLGITATPFHWLIGVTVLFSCGLAAHEIATVAFGRKRARLAVLRALGWPRRRLLALQVLGVVALSLAAGAAPSALLLAAALMLGQPGPGLLSVAVCLVVSVGLLGLASLSTFRAVYRLEVSDVMRNG
jgi:hypothetical protein